MKSNIFLIIANKIPDWLKPYVLLLVSAVLMIFAFSPWGVWPLGFLCFIPLFYLFLKSELSQLSYKKALLWAFFYGLLIDLFAFHWLIHTMRKFGHLPLPLAILLFIGYVAITNTRYFLFFALLVFYRKNIENSTKYALWLKNPYLLFSFFWALSELLGWQLFPYYGSNLVSTNSWFIQAVDLIGVKGLSILWLMFSYYLYQVFMQLIENQSGSTLWQWLLKQKVRFVMPILFVVLHLYGFLAINYWSADQKSYAIKNIAIPQGNTPLAFESINSYAGFKKYMKEIVSTMTGLSKSIAEKAEKEHTLVDLFVWPESSIPFISYLDSSNTYFKEGVKDLLKRHPAEIILNDVESTVTVDGRREDHSNMWLVGNDGAPLEYYHKVFLLPFGEYIPMGNIFQFLKTVVPEVSDFTPGNRFVLFKSKVGNILPLVCYEVIPGDFVWSFFVKTGLKAQLLVNITNDSWFGKSIESAQHFELGRMRAIELRLPLIRSTNAGISGYVDITGKVIDPTPLFAKAQRLYRVAVPKRNITLYALWGSLPYYLYILVFTLAIITSLFGWLSATKHDEKFI